MLKEQGKVSIVKMRKELAHLESNLNGGTKATNAQEGVLHGQHPSTTNIPLSQPFIYINLATAPHLIQGF